MSVSLGRADDGGSESVQPPIALEDLPTSSPMSTSDATYSEKKFGLADSGSNVGQGSTYNNENKLEYSEKALQPPQDEKAPVEDLTSQNMDQEAVGEPAEDDSKYPGGFKIAIITIGLAGATFMVALDNFIIATAIPRITSDFDSLDDIGWYGSGYLLTLTAFQMSFGKIYTYWSMKWTFLTALIILEVGSVVCAVAPNSKAMIVGRAVAGIGGSGLFSGVMTIIAYSVPLRKRALYLGGLTSMFGVSSVVGPLLGGVFTDRLSWRWCFWINLPIGGLTIFTMIFFFQDPRREQQYPTLLQGLAKVDLLGAFFLLAAITSILIALGWGGTQYPWSDSKVWGCILSFCLLSGVFVAIQVRLGENATVPPRIISQRTVAASCAYMTFISMAFGTFVYYLPIYFQAIRNDTAQGSGISTIPFLVSNTIVSLLVGGGITTLGWYTPFMWFGSLMFLVGAALLHTLKVGAIAGQWIGYQIAAGIGAGAAVQIPFISVQVVLDKADIPSGTTLVVFCNSFGGAVAISVAQTIFSNTLSRELGRHIPQLDPRIVLDTGATQFREVTPRELLAAVFTAYDTAVTTAYILPIAVCGVAFLCSLAVEWRSVKGKAGRLAAPASRESR